MEIEQYKLRHNGSKILGILELVLIILIVLVGTSAADSPVADFTAFPLEHRAPSIVQFTDNSKCNPSYWYWQFGDGGTLSGNALKAKNPKHLYTTGGSYTVTLTIVGRCNETYYNTSTTKYDYIAVYGF